MTTAEVRLPLAAWPTVDDHDRDTVRYGPLGPDETTARLLGAVDTKRVLVLGAAGATVVALARAGARVSVAEPDQSVIDASQAACAAAGVSAEHLHGGLAELAAVRGDSTDLTVAIYSLNAVPDLDRVFRQVHRVLRPDAPLVFSMPHPIMDLLDDERYADRPYGLRSPIAWQQGSTVGDHHPTSIGHLFTHLSRASLRVDTVIESDQADATSPFWTPAMTVAPNTVIIRARKLGV